MKQNAAGAPRVGLFGLLGSGNIGNDISMQAVLNYLRSAQPVSVIDAMCMGPERVTADAGIAAIPLQWSRAYEERASGLALKAVRAVGKIIDVVRTAAWVRRHDVVIVPGMGVLEASTPINPWGVPYALLLLAFWGRVFRTKVALVSVGATRIDQRSVRWVSTWAARLASYRSYRDVHSREAMRQRGVDVSHDQVFPDLVFAIPAIVSGVADTQTVGVGVMAYYGTNDDRPRAKQIHASYTSNMTRFVQWLLDHGRTVLLFIGDSGDTEAVEEIFAELRASHPGLAPGRVVAAEITSFAGLMQAMSPASTVVATRFHNVMCALKLGKPAISVGYSDKNVSLMESMGVAEFCQHANDIDFDRLVEQFTDLERHSDEIRVTLEKRNAELAARLAEQFTLLDSTLFADR